MVHLKFTTMFMEEAWVYIFILIQLTFSIDLRYRVNTFLQFRPAQKKTEYRDIKF